ncbi:RNA chaperone ProQ [Alteromonas flava]|uniref:RNA chaperone ProQ n=1 Tax=Alteromonas flava TaxID=2048003 RepID=UPI000C290108|nr:RNA chaperone ProQ [Alteromonas flava]
MDSTEKLANSKEVIAFLAEKFPNCFSVSGQAKPLKVGIFQDLAEALQDEPKVSKTLLRSSLRHYTNSWRYLESVVVGAHRVDLAGEHDAEIEAEHAEHAQKQLAESKALAAEKRKDQKRTPKKRSDKPRQGKSEKSNGIKKTGTSSPNTRSNKPTPQKLTTDDMVVGTKVTVKLGKVPMPAVITEVAKDGIHVQLDTGMVVKVAENALRLASPKRS